MNSCLGNIMNMMYVKTPNSVQTRQYNLSFTVEAPKEQVPFCSIFKELQIALTCLANFTVCCSPS